MSKTPRTDEQILHHANGNWHPSAFVLASFARQLETELADARAEIERLALEIENKQYTITCASEENQQLKESLAEARAEIERLRQELRDNSTLAARQIVPAEMLVDDLTAEIERKDKLIEQMLEALKAIDAIGSEKGDASRDDALRCFSIARAALAAERGE